MASETLTALRALAAEEELAIEAVTPADFAWAAALQATDPSWPRGICAIQLSGTAPQTRLLAIVDGTPVAMRRLPPIADDSILREAVDGLAAVDPVEGTPGSWIVLALGDAAFRERVRSAATDAGCSPIEPPGVVAELDFSPERVAAAFAGVGPPFVPPDVVEAARARNRRRTVISAFVAGLLLIIAAAFDTLDLRRELAAVTHARSAHADAVTEVLARRVSLDELTDVTLDLDTRRQNVPRWTLLLTSLADELPEGARVISLRADADSIHLELEASDAAAAFEAMRATPWFTSFQAAAPVQREVDEGSELRERLTATAAVAWVDLNGRRVTGGEP